MLNVADLFGPYPGLPNADDVFLDAYLDVFKEQGAIVKDAVDFRSRSSYSVRK